MARGECYTPSPECKYYPNCYSDLHHIAGRKGHKAILELTVQICRRRHEEIHHDPDLGLFPIPEDI